MAKDYTNITTPGGRLVSSSLYDPRTKDFDGKPMAFKDGTPKADYSVGIAIPKGTEQHWNQTPWGAQIWAIGDKGHPGGHVNSPMFSWKIQDGDSTVPNKKGIKNCDREGYPGCWVLYASRSCAADRLTPPCICNANGSQPITDPGAVKPGYFVQLRIAVADNSPSQTPGVYINLEMVALSGYGPEIISRTQEDPSSVGFGQGPLPAGASLTPPAGIATQAPTPAAYAPPPAAPAPVAVTPNPAFALGVPVPPAPAAPAAPSAPPAHVMTPAAGGITYEAYRAASWTDAQLIQNGMMLA